MSNENDDFTKGVEFKDLEEEEQIATGAVLVPNELDHAGDYLSAGTIESLAKDYQSRFDSGDVYGGVMHTVFPTDMSLVESRVTDDTEVVGEEEYPPGTWIQSYRFEDDNLWDLVKSGVIGGYSIGGKASGTTKTIPPHVTVPDGVAENLEQDVDDLTVRQIEEGEIMETSAVDFPAVSRATHEEYKSVEKGHPALQGGPVQARLHLESRGHSAEDAKRLAEYIQEQKNADSEKDTSPVDQLKNFFRKDGRALSTQNVAAAMAIHDASLDLLNSSDIDVYDQTRFTDNPTRDFDIGEYGDTEEKNTGTNTLNTTMDEELRDALKDIKDSQESLESRLDDIESNEDEIGEIMVEQGEAIKEMQEAQGVSKQNDGGDTEEDAGVWKDSPFAVGGN